MATPEKPENDAAEAATETSTNTGSTLLKSISANALMLGLFALACTALIAGTFTGTKENIEEQQRQARLRALYEIVPTSRHDNDLLADNMAFFETELGHRREQRLYLAMQGEAPVALIYPATARDGYSGDIRYIVGINLADHSVAGVRVLEHRETPGLGDGIETRKSDWIHSFVGKSLGAPELSRWTVKKNGGVFDGFTGATITPRALVESVASVLQYHELHGGKLLAALKLQRANSRSQELE